MEMELQLELALMGPGSLDSRTRQVNRAPCRGFRRRIAQQIATAHAFFAVLPAADRGSGKARSWNRELCSTTLGVVVA